MTVGNDWDWRIYCGNKSCDFSVELKFSELRNYFDSKFNKKIYETNKEYDINIFSELYDDIMCGNCEEFPLIIIDNHHQLILDPKNIIPCEECEKPILLTRLKIAKGTKVCTPCARKNEKNEVERIKIFNDEVMPPSPPVPNNMKICERCGANSTTRYTISTGNWFVACSTFPKCWWKKQMPQIANVKGANISFDLKDSANNLLYAAKEAVKVNNLQILKDIYEEMIYRQENRIVRGKSKNRRLDEYANAVLGYIKSLDDE